MESQLRDNVVLNRIEAIQLAADNEQFEQRLLLLLNEVEARPLSMMERDLLDELLHVYSTKLNDGDVLLRYAYGCFGAWL